MSSITAVIHNGRIELTGPVDWPDGTRVEVTPMTASANEENDNSGVSLEEFEAGLDELASASDTIPILSAEAYTREGIYGNE